MAGRPEEQRAGQSGAGSKTGEEAAESARIIADNVRDLIEIVDFAAEQADEAAKIRLQTIRERLLAASQAVEPDQ